MRFCARCGCKVDVESEIPHYPYICCKHDENLCGWETYLSYEIELILFGCYLHDWVKTHDEGEPVCFDEFMDNEFWDEEWMEHLLTLYGMHHKIADYRKALRD